MLVRLDNVSHNFSSQDLFFDVDLTVYEGDRIALIGQNGSGKTTLFNIISGDVEPIEGSVIRNNSLNIRFLKQFRADNASENLVQFLRASIVEEIDDIVINKSIRSILIGLGFEETQWERQVSTLSGGELTRLALGRTLVGLNNNMDNFMLEKKIPLLLLDEPTNHLDLYSIKWLISYLRSLRVTMITISHDRNFIKELSNKFWEINNYKVWDFSGDYETYMNQRENLLLSIQARKKNLEREMERLERMIDRYRKWATEKMVRQAIIRERSLEKLKKEYQEIESMQELKSIKIKIPEPEKTGYVVLKVEKLSFAYEEKSILESISFEVGEGQKISVIGKNGCGKTTLLNILLGKLQQSSGTYQWGHNIKIGYLDQVISSFNQKLDLISEIWKLVPDWKDFEVRKYLGRFGFEGENVFKTIGDLSGGELTRLALSKLILGKPNVLILDEPTNHLDILTVQTLEETLKEFSGAIILVSHDERLLRNISDKFVFIKDGISESSDNLDAFLQDIKEDTFKLDKNKNKDTQSWEDSRKLKNKRKSLEAKVQLLGEKLEDLLYKLDKVEKDMVTNGNNYQKVIELMKIKSELEQELVSTEEQEKITVEELKKIASAEV